MCQAQPGQAVAATVHRHRHVVAVRAGVVFGQPVEAERLLGGGEGVLVPAQLRQLAGQAEQRAGQIRPEDGQAELGERAADAHRIGDCRQRLVVQAGGVEPVGEVREAHRAYHGTVLGQ